VPRRAPFPVGSVRPAVALAPGRTILPERPGQVGDDRFERTGGPDHFEPFGFDAGPPGRDNRDDRDALEVEVGLGPDDVTRLGAGIEEPAVEHPSGLAGSRCPPVPGAVVALTGELDVDPARHGPTTYRGTGVEPHAFGQAAGVETTVLTIDTGRELVTDLTPRVEQYCAGRGDGLLHVFAPHATAGLALIELGSGSETDLAELLVRWLPRDDRYRHRHGTPGHGADHLLPALVSPSLTLAVLSGRPALGTWQSVVLVDPNVDNRRRSVRLSFLAG
jgi:secondary thiamine-phosphate synthase enzyme